MKIGSTILIVEDEEIHRLILKRILESKGYKVLEAVNGAAGLKIMRTSKVDLTIVDLEMPVMNGIEFTKWVKGVNPSFPIIIVTAHAADFPPQDIIAANVEALIPKPVVAEELLNIIRDI